MQTCVFKFVFEIITVGLSYVKGNLISIVLYLYFPHSFKTLLPPPPNTDYFGPFFIKWKSSGWDHNEVCCQIHCKVFIHFFHIWSSLQQYTLDHSLLEVLASDFFLWYKIILVSAPPISFHFLFLLMMFSPREQSILFLANRVQFSCVALIIISLIIHQKLHLSWNICCYISMNQNNLDFITCP